MNQQDLDSIAESHAFWWNQAMQAFEEMKILAFDLSETHTDEFAKAKERFELARNRARLEFNRWETLGEHGATGDETDLETGQSL